MRFIHQNLPEEANYAALEIKRAYDLPLTLEAHTLEHIFRPVPAFKGVSYQCNFQKLWHRDLERMIILTSHDLFADNKSQEDDWIFGSCWMNMYLASTARLKGRDNKPREKREVSPEHYLKRVTALILHELGHDLIDNPAYEQAVWINAQTGYQLPLGPHCTNPSCLMWECVDIRTPPQEEGWMELGGKPVTGTGIDDVLERVSENWLCSQCSSCIKKDSSWKQ